MTGITLTDLTPQEAQALAMLAGNLTVAQAHQHGVPGLYAKIHEQIVKQARGGDVRSATETDIPINRKRRVHSRGRAAQSPPKAPPGCAPAAES